jgi:Family of unknown function (DUF5999)
LTLQEQPASDYGELQKMITAPPAPAPHVCTHTPPCPSAAQLDRDAAHVIVAHPEQGWSLLCNGVVLFEDTGELLPDGRSIAARRQELLAAAAHRKS